MTTNELNSILRKARMAGHVSMVFQSERSIYIELRKGNEKTRELLKSILAYCKTTTIVNV